ncbi:MAG: PKD domain-containing protein [Planctomycetaceae bacterium]|nr:PKD domain-containing protein [Planctomycetaceae bacterium]
MPAQKIRWWSSLRNGLRVQPRRRSRRSLPDAVSALEPRTLLTAVTVFDNGAFVDTAGSTFSESDNVQASLVALGHTVSTFTATSAAGISAALAGQDTLLIPELERGNLSAALSPAARSVISSFVSSGGTLVIHGDTGADGDEALINGIFGFNITSGIQTSSGVSTLAAGAAGTPFAGGPASIPNNNGTYMWLTSSLPSSAQSAYEFGTSRVSSAVVSIPEGAGLINFLAYDWFDAAPRGSQNGGWLEVLDRAVGTAAPNTPPAADAGGPYSVPEGGSVTLSGAGSTDSDGTIASYEWDFDFTGTFDVDATGAAPTFSAAGLDDSVRTIALRVTDDDGAVSSIVQTTLTVDNVAPTVSGLSVSATQISEGESIELTGSLSDPGVLDDFSLVIDWGDGNVETVALAAGTTSFAVPHVYADDDPSVTPADQYTVSVSLTDDDGGDAARTAELFDNGRAQDNQFSGLFSSELRNWRVYDDFSLTAAATLESVFFQQGITAGTQLAGFQFAVYANASGVPGALIYSQELTSTDYTAVPNSVSSFPFGPFFDITFDLTSPLNLAEGDYFVSFYGRGNTDFRTPNVDSRSQFSNFLQQPGSGSFFPRTGDTPFTLFQPEGLPTFDVTVNNVAPVISEIALSDVISENETATLSGSFTDPGLLDEHTLTVDWGDGTTETITLPVGERDFALTHTYLDDGPSPGNGTASDQYQVSILLSDDDGGTDIALPTTEILTNGSFESGSFSGWTANTTGTPFRPWRVSGAGLGGGFGMDRTSPQDGSQVAWNGFDGNGPLEFQLYQDVLIPTNGEATLQWQDRLQWNFDPGRFASEPRTYNVQIRDPQTNAVLASLYSFSTGTQSQTPVGDTGWQTHSADVTAFAGQNVRIYFVDAVPQAFTGPGQFELDGVSLLVANPLSVTVNNVAPTVDVSLADTTISEGDLATLNGLITDPGTLDEFTLDVDWGSAGTSTFALGSSALTAATDGIDWDPVTREFSVSRLFADDDPTGTPADDFSIAVTVTDDDTGSGTDSAVLTVENVAPEVSLNDPAPLSDKGDTDSPVVLVVDFDDPGLQDTHTVVVNWGDGSTDTVALTSGERSVAVSHTYLTGGVFSIDVSVTDDDTGTGTASQTAVISGVGIQEVDGENVLQIIGTAGDDHISINQTGNGRLKVHWDALPDEVAEFALADVDRVMVILCDGDDHLSVSGRVTLPVIADGGAGDDHINAGAGQTVVLGGDGDDHINGGDGRSILIGGGGQDRIVGGPGNSIMTGGVYADASGATDVLSNYRSLLDTLDRWSGDIDDLIAGADPLEDAQLAAFYAQVGDDDAAPDVLTGSAGFDWTLLFDGDTLTDAGSNANGNGNGGGNGKGKGKK